jgi:predicted GIY-YIG superfamily endonuclease
MICNGEWLNIAKALFRDSHPGTPFFRLVHWEVFGDIRDAIAREKEIKAWRREKKARLIRFYNPTSENQPYSAVNIAAI